MNGMNPGTSHADYPKGLEKCTTRTISLCLQASLFHQCSCFFCWEEENEEAQRREAPHFPSFI